MAMPFQNVWHLRTVGDSSSKACYICYKTTTRVMITPDNKDFFYICSSHLSDKGFASPIIDEKAEAEKRKKEAMAREIEKVKQEYEEKQKKKKAKKAKEDDKEKDKKKDDADDVEAEKERDDKIKSIEAGAKTEDKIDEGTRIFALHRDFYQMRVNRLKNIETARRNQQRLKDPAFFPSTPKGNIN